MNRRNFLRGLLGTAAAAVVAPFVRTATKPAAPTIAGIFGPSYYSEVMYHGIPDEECPVCGPTQRQMMLMQLHSKGIISRDSMLCACYEIDYDREVEMMREEQRMLML